MRKICSIFCFLMVIAGCSPIENVNPGPPMYNGIACNGAMPESVRYNIATSNGTAKTDMIRVSATGYGAPPKKYYPENQRQLMARRASKIDAYRALAETVNGLHIWGGTTIGDAVVQNDHYRVFLDAFVRGARVISVGEKENGNVETVLEAVIDQKMLNYILSDEPAGTCGNKGGNSPAVLTSRYSPAHFYYSE